MRNVVPFLSVLCLLSSCFKYQYLELSSPGTKLYQTNEFITENDTFRVVYRFHDRMNISVFNKSAKRVAIDWSKSAITDKKGRVRAVYPEEVNIRKVRKGTRTDLIDTSSAQLIPPLGTVNSGSIEFNDNDKFVALPTGDRKKDFVHVKGRNRKITRQAIPFDASPMVLNVHLALSVDDKPADIKRIFYLSQVINTKVKPEHIKEPIAGSIVNERLNVVSVIVQTVISVPIILFLAHLNAQEEN